MLLTRDRREGFVDYVTARRPHLHRYAYLLCGDWHAADDLVQIALAKAYVAWPRIRRTGSEDAYVRRALARVAVDQSRRPWRRETAGLAGQDTIPATAADPDDQHDLFQALAALPEMQRRTVVLRHWWGLPVAETAGVGTLGVLESGDGQYWAECYVWSDMSDGRRPAVVVYPAAGNGAWGYSAGAGCELVDGQVPGSCRRFTLRWADRLPDEVATVRFETSDGETTDIDSVDGYVVLNYEGDLPEGVSFTPQGDTGPWSPLRRVTYLGGDGEPLAAEAFDRTGTGRENNRVDGLPPLSSQASLRGSPVM